MYSILDKQKTKRDGLALFDNEGPIKERKDLGTQEVIAFIYNFFSKKHIPGNARTKIIVTRHKFFRNLMLCLQQHLLP